VEAKAFTSPFFLAALRSKLKTVYVGPMSQCPNAIEEAERAGFDLSLIDANLSYSYEKRVLLHDAALALALEMERVGRELRGGA
jgi:hypothetical protein